KRHDVGTNRGGVTNQRLHSAIRRRFGRVDDQQIRRGRVQEPDGGTMKIPRVVLVAALGIAAAPVLRGEEQRGQPAANPPATAKVAAPIDLTGNWVSIVTEDWRWRMVTPAKGDYASIPMTPAAKMVADAWDPAKDEAAGEQWAGEKSVRRRCDED